MGRLQRSGEGGRMSTTEDEANPCEQGHTRRVFCIHLLLAIAEGENTCAKCGYEIALEGEQEKPR